MRKAALALGCSLVLAGPAYVRTARAEDAPVDPASIHFATAPPEGKTAEVDTTLPAPPPEAPPPRPRRKGVVLESTIGSLAFAGQFRHVAPPSFWLHAQLGYEIWRWLMVFGESELAMTDTSEAQDAAHQVTLPLFAFGGGLRGTVHLTERVALFLQGDVGTMEAIVSRGTLANLGYAGAEGFNPYLGGRLGAEWYMVDRHLAVTAQLGGREAEGFALSRPGQRGGGDTPLMADAALGLRYTF